ncbi:MAG TPA: sigma 54-interacting transcriptional regulator [Nostoc sp.]|uniref:sigma-54-dependent transcriptional regulator n=1 Tax=Nostoc sp. TaxID=1180 RepID=UPI002D6FBA58|nr:sigma 54-interacting transcriptional regulator [Nostoc sp.]HYX17467.1 sigma 54-interacting transcriptional regulator [Nostoc sp.]
MAFLNDRKILVVEDDQYEITNIKKILGQISGNFRIVETVSQAFDALSREAFDLLLSDLHIETKAGFERPDGLKVIAFARQQQPNLVIVANSSDPRSDIWNEALAAGAQHFIRKPLTKADELIIAFNLAKERKTLISSKNEKRTVRKSSYAHYLEQYPEGVVFDRLDMQRAQGLAKKHSIPAVLFGETGTGKEEFARLVHRLRIRQEGEIPFIAVNCATITEGLAESLLFGHRKGSFTGAHETTTGYIAEADAGILFLDEIHALDLKIQQKLLRALNDGTFNRLGETRTYTSRFQLICATTKDLDDEAEAGRFLLDLRGRISGIDIQMKPLRERKEHIPALSALFLIKRGIHLEADHFELLCRRLSEYYWRTNIRQLIKVLDAWLIRCDFEDLSLHPDHLPIIKGMTAPGGDVTRRGETGNNCSAADIHRLIDRAIADDINLEICIAEVEKVVIEAAVSRHKTLGAAADALGMARSTFDARRKKLGLL